MKMRPLVLAISADDRVGVALREGFARAALDTVVAPSAALGLRALSTLTPDVVFIDLDVADLPMPELRERIASRGDAGEMLVVAVRACEPPVGAQGPCFALEPRIDDTRALTPRMLGAHIARALRARTVSVLESSIEVGALRLDGRAARAFVHDVELQLTTIELRLLATFAKWPGQTLSREQILLGVWGIRPRASRSIYTHMKRLRRKLGAAAPLLATVRGVGYRLEAAPPIHAPRASA